MVPLGERNMSEEDIERTQMISVQDVPEEKPQVRKTKTVRRLSSTGRKLIMVLMIAAGAMVAYSGWKIWSGLRAYRKGDAVYENVSAAAYTETKTNEAPAEKKDRVSFAALAEINPDVVGWLKLDGTVIDYPVVQGSDNEYYLSHMFNGDINVVMGSLFLDCEANPQFKDRNTLLFGHHTNNGSMFCVLEEYKKQEFYDAHKQMELQTPDGDYILEPVAGRVMDAKIPFMLKQFANDDEFLNFVNGFVENSTFAADTAVTAADRIITMCTCTDDFQDARYVLICRMVPED